MKNSLRILIASMIILVLFQVQSVAQFTDAVNPDDNSILSPVFSQNTGNYIIDVGSSSFAVSVWDDPNGPNSALEWKVGSSIGYTLIDPTTQVLDPDVCLVENQVGVVYAIVAYYDVTNSQFMMRTFNWASVSQQFVGGAPEMLLPGTYGTAINIDANDEGDFVIVWDQPGQLIQTVFGQTPSVSAPTLSFPGAVFNLDAGIMPDVSMYRSTTTGEKPVHVVYKNVGNFIVVDSYRFADMLSGLFNLIQLFRSPAADLVYRYPRIDSPTSGIGTETDMTIVVEDSDNSGTWYIKGFNSHNCCPGYSQFIYNDGLTGNSPYDLTSVPNTRPVVSYYDNGDGVMVGWNLDNSFGLITAPGASMSRQPIALSCDKKAKPNFGCSYLYVPFGVTTGTQVGLLSVSGKYSNSGFYTYLNSNTNSIQYKQVTHVNNAQNLRSGNSSGFNDWINDLYQSGDAANISVTLNAYDVLGKQVFSYHGNLDGMLDSWNQFSKSCPVGIYALNAFESKEGSGFKGKIFTAR